MLAFNEWRTALNGHDLRKEALRQYLQDSGETPDDRVVIAERTRQDFKSAMRRFATSVAIITCGAGSDRFGMTATAITSVTADPPTLLACINRSAGIHGVLHVGSHLCINLLATRHAELSSAFSGGVASAERFHYGSWAHDEHNTPFLQDAQCNFFCQVDVLLSYRTHTIFLGRVESIALRGDFEPLIYGNGTFLSL